MYHEKYSFTSKIKQNKEELLGKLSVPIRRMYIAETDNITMNTVMNGSSWHVLQAEAQALSVVSDHMTHSSSVSGERSASRWISSCSDSQWFEHRPNMVCSAEDGRTDRWVSAPHHRADVCRFPATLHVPRSRLCLENDIVNGKRVWRQSWDEAVHRKFYYNRLKGRSRQFRCFKKLKVGSEGTFSLFSLFGTPLCINVKGKCNHVS